MQEVRIVQHTIDTAWPRRYCGQELFRAQEDIRKLKKMTQLLCVRPPLCEKPKTYSSSLPPIGKTECLHTLSKEYQYPRGCGSGA